MDAATLIAIAQFFRQYQNEAAFQNLIAARGLLAAAKQVLEGSYEQKVLCARVFFELMQSCENVIRLLRVVHELPTRNPVENLLDRDLPYFRPENLESLEQELRAFEGGRLEAFCDDFLHLHVDWPRLPASERIAQEGIYGGVMTAIQNLNVRSAQAGDRTLKELYNKMKHGGAIVNNSADATLVAHLRPDRPVTMTATVEVATRWCDTVEAMCNTIRNLSYSVAEDLEGEAKRLGS